MCPTLLEVVGNMTPGQKTPVNNDGFFFFFLQFTGICSVLKTADGEF